MKTEFWNYITNQKIMYAKCKINLAKNDENRVLK